MKKIIIALMAIIMNAFLFSCTTESIAETDELLNVQATEGDDGNIPPAPPPPPPGQ